MSEVNVRRPVMERNRNLNGREKPTQNFLSKHLKKVYPIALRRSISSQSLSSLSLSQNSNDSIGETIPPPRVVDRNKVLVSLRGLGTSHERAETKLTNLGKDSFDSNGVTLKRCNWITKNSDQVYVCFHDEYWGVPVYNDNQLFELLAMSGMLMDYNWTEILKRKELLREYFTQFNPNLVAKLSEKEIVEISSNKTLMLAESRVRCIVDNAKCIVKIAHEYGSFSSYIWGHMNYKPMINRYKYPRNVPLRTPKAEIISRDLLRRGFRFVGPVIVYSFMQASGMTIDHLVDCFRFSECVSLAERPWRHG
ncbi:LOW QUALITY PROTEIN: DNA-3-methyladenine glycosylase-like [Telopea speciosissima]|uniref:LOW QUALITY PROTEIN: DNA-3-methyladenine glycosylase-like n=1 Tax=Telopea speciosissima TaxID=54955 RepID=UPI001CC45A22|nr:LOW QUALITY PROTEIN: DNA-3-methyladenine glycosylase-like [Telopea speciosissima]